MNNPNENSSKTAFDGSFQFNDERTSSPIDSTKQVGGLTLCT